MSLNEKQEKIINAAIIEFAEKGFKAASTNEIIKNAGVSKGLLFHYYTNKQILYLEVLGYCTDYLLEEAKKNIWQEKKDVFERLNDLVFMKLRLFEQNPHIYEILFSFMMYQSEDIKKELKEEELEYFKHIQDKQKGSIYLLYENLDYSLFKEGLDIAKIIEIITYVMNGLSMKYMKTMEGQDSKMALKNVDAMIKDMDGYISVLKQAFYK